MKDRLGEDRLLVVLKEAGATRVANASLTDEPPEGQPNEMSEDTSGDAIVAVMGQCDKDNVCPLGVVLRRQLGRYMQAGQGDRVACNGSPFGGRATPPKRDSGRKHRGCNHERALRACVVVRSGLYLAAVLVEVVVLPMLHSPNGIRRA